MAEALAQTMNARKDISEYRHEFPALKSSEEGKAFAYLDTAASAQKPQAVIDAMSALQQDHYANIHRGLYAYSHKTTSAFEGARRKVSSFINAFSQNEVIFTRNTTEAINLVAQSWGNTFLSKGDEIILTEMEHHANIVPWQLLRDKIGIIIKTVPVTDSGEFDLDAYKKLLSDRTKLVGVVHTSNALGIINPVSKIIELANEFNSEIKVLIDGSQAILHSDVDVQMLGCDFYAFTGHKLYGPTGIGVLWGREELLNEMPPYQGGGDMIETVTFEKTTYKKAPSRFEAGTPAITEAIGLAAAIDYVNKVGMNNIEAHEAVLLEYARRELKGVDGLNFYGTGTRKAGILSFTAEWGHPSDIGMILDQCGVAVRTGHHCCQPLMARYGIDATVRASFGLYTNKDDIDLLVSGLQTAKGLLS